MSKFFHVLGEATLNSLNTLGEIFLFFWRASVAALLPPYNYKLLLEQMYEIGVKSISIVLVSASAIGMVMVIQMAWGFERFGAKLLVGPVVTLSFVRELGPVVTSLLVGGRVGSGITAEIGSMKVTEQIDAIKTLGADPVKKLVAPRLLASIIVFPLLAVISNLAGIGGSIIMAAADLNISPTMFISSIKGWVFLDDILTGISKTLFFGIIVAITGCYVGMKADGGTQGVGRATTKTVVIALLLIIISDFILSKLFVIFVYD